MLASIVPKIARAPVEALGGGYLFPTSERLLITTSVTSPPNLMPTRELLFRFAVFSYVNYKYSSDVHVSNFVLLSTK